jgi:Zn-dependent M28 family amino/carboxypeptidase
MRLGGGLLIGVLVCGFTQATPPSRVDADALIADVRTLAAFDGRQTGSEGNRRARAFIVERFRRLGLKPVGGTFEQPFTVARRGARDTSPSRPAAERLEGVNVMALREGAVDRDRFILVTAHYDHLGVRNGQVYPGADDNASGVAAMLAAAAWFAAHPPRVSMLFVAFDAEEQGLQGAKHFVAKPPIDLKRVHVIVNADMISRGDANTLHVAGTHHTPRLKEPVEEAARGRPIAVRFGHDRPVAQAGVEDWTRSSDHGPFHDAGIPFLYFGVEDHPDYHRPTDTPDRIPVPFFDTAVEVVVDTVRRLSGG